MPDNGNECTDYERASHWQAARRVVPQIVARIDTNITLRYEKDTERYRKILSHTRRQ